MVKQDNMAENTDKTDKKEKSKVNNLKLSPVINQTQNLTDILIKNGAISKDQLRVAIIELKSRKNDAKILDILVELGFLQESTINSIISAEEESKKKLNIDVANFDVAKEIIEQIPYKFAIKNKIIPLRFHDNKLDVAMKDIYDILIIDRLSNIFKGYKIKPISAKTNDILQCIYKNYNYSSNIIAIMDAMDKCLNDENTEDIKNGSSNPVVNFVDTMIKDSIRMGASDIHVEPDRFFVRTRVRVDGVLQTLVSFHKKHWDSVCVRIKILSNMNIAETRRPQDGSFSQNLGEKSVYFRVSAMPGIYGENIVIRILDESKSIVSLESLGYLKHSLKAINLALKKPEGIFIVTGPTGSGKTTTLYSILSRINTMDKNIMTLENPVEYRLPIIRQSQIDYGVDFDFSSGLRTLLRQDPDIIFLGEIRDFETANIAISASMTGHKVFSTLHTNDALSSVVRLIDMGIKEYLIGVSVCCIVSQRLLRKVCPHCSIKEEINDSYKQILDLPIDKIFSVSKAKTGGCEKCNKIGYKGRTVVSEVLTVDKDLSSAISDNASYKEMLKIAVANGFISIQKDAIYKVVTNQTTLDEACRVLDMTEYIEKFEKNGISIISDED